MFESNRRPLIVRRTSRRAAMWAAAGLLVAGLLPAGGCKKDGGAAASGKATVVVGTEPQFPPFESRGASGEFEGFDIDLVKAVGAKAGFAVEFKDLGFDALIPSLGTGQIQLAASAMSITDERKKVVDFSDPYHTAEIGLTVRINETAIKSADDLKGKTVAVQTGTTGATLAESLKKDGKVANIKYFPNAPLAVMELARGGADAVINDRPAAEAYLAAMPGQAKLLAQVLQSDDYGLAVRKGNAELLGKVNAALKALKADGTIDGLKAKHLKSPIAAGVPATLPAMPAPSMTMPSMPVPAMTMPSMPGMTTRPATMPAP